MENYRLYQRIDGDGEIIIVHHHKGSSTVIYNPNQEGFIGHIKKITNFEKYEEIRKDTLIKFPKGIAYTNGSGEILLKPSEDGTLTFPYVIIKYGGIYYGSDLDGWVEYLIQV